MSHGFTTEQISFIKQLMTSRNKEVRHEVSDHLDNTLPYKKIAGLGGSIPADGCTITSDTSSTGGVKWVGDGASSVVTLAEAAGIVNGSTTAGGYHIGYQAGYLIAIGNNFGQFHRALIKSADHAITGRTAQLRIAVGLIVNGTAPGASFTIELRRVNNLGGGAGGVVLTAEVSASLSVTFTTPSAATVPQSESSWTTFDSTNFPDGQYYFRIAPSTTTAANSAVGVMCQLQKRYV